MLSWVPLVGLLLGLAAIVLGAVALTTHVRKTRAAVGLALGVGGLVVNVIVLAALGAAASGKANVAADAPVTTVETVDAVPTTASTTGAASPTAVITTAAAPPAAVITTVAAPPVVKHTTAAAPPAVKHTTAAPAVKPPTVEEENAIRSAQGYLAFAAFSRKGLIRQLSSDAGDGYSVKAATYAVDSLHVDFDEQAYKSAQSYLAMEGFSRNGLIEQLESDAGEGFTHSQAVYGVKKAGL